MVIAELFSLYANWAGRRRHLRHRYHHRNHRHHRLPRHSHSRLVERLKRQAELEGKKWTETLVAH